MVENSGSAETTREEVDIASEFIFLGLRLNNGINLAEYQNRFGLDLEAKYRGDLNRLKEAELLEISDGHLRLTQKGMLFSNEVFAVFV